MAVAISSTALPKAASFALEGFCAPLTLRTYWSADARISSSVAGGSRLWSLVMFRHMPATVAPQASSRSSCEVFSLDALVVPRENLVGGIPGGWSVLMHTRDYERISAARLGGDASALDEVERHLEETGRLGPSAELVARLRGELDTARLPSVRAAWLPDRGEPAAPNRGSRAPSPFWAGSACRAVTSSAHQVHGAIGFALETGLHRYHRPAKAVQVRTAAVRRVVTSPSRGRPAARGGAP